MLACSMLLRFLLTEIACTLFIADTRADNWERFRGPNGNGISNDKNVPVEFSEDCFRFETGLRLPSLHMRAPEESHERRE